MMNILGTGFFGKNKPPFPFNKKIIKSFSKFAGSNTKHKWIHL